MNKIVKSNCGIYLIKNMINGKVYIGSTKDFIGRKKAHFTMTKHHNLHLDRAFKKYGKKNFEFIPIQYCKKTELLINEQYWMNHFESRNRDLGYNIQNVAEFPQFKQEVIERSFIYCYAKDGKFINKYESVSEACFNTGADSSEVYRCLKGTKPSANSYMFSSIFKEKLPPFNSKRSNKVLYTNTKTGENIEFEAALQAERYLNIPVGTIRKRIKLGEMKHTHGMIFSYVDK